MDAEMLERLTLATERFEAGMMSTDQMVRTMERVAAAAEEATASLREHIEMLKAVRAMTRKVRRNRRRRELRAERKGRR